MPYVQRNSQNVGPSGGGVAAFGSGGVDIPGIANLETCKIGGVSVSAANASLADVTATAAELNSTTGLATSATIELSASAAVQTATITLKDANGATVADVRHVRVYLATSDTGVTLAAAANSTVAPTTGTILKAHTAKLDWDGLTSTGGVWVLSIDNTGGSDHYAVYVVLALPNGDLVISAVTDVRSS